MELGQFGNQKAIRDDVCELKIDVGAGYRVYYAHVVQHDPELAAEYLNSVLEDGDEADLMLALRALSKVFGGVQEVARQAEVNAHTLYRTLSEQGNPELKTLSAILRAMGMRLAVQPIPHAHV